ncbi:MAG: hemolysin D [Alphaproteobacteria bacterium]|nr:MAG: hemolysin D [Alphaproteobacteria bacterium]
MADGRRDAMAEGAPPAEIRAAPAPAPVSTPSPPVRRRRLRRVLLLLGPVLLIAVAAYAYVTGGRFVGTDNAYVKAHMVSVSADISGRVVEVMVRENQRVEPGQKLFRLDEEPLRLALAEARANVDAVRNDIAAQKAAYRQAEEQLKLAEANVGFAEREYRRRETLVAQQIVSESEFDEARNQYQVALREAAAVRQDMERILSELAGDPAIDPDTHPRVREAEAQAARGTLDLRHALVTAPVAGIVSRVDSLRPGDYIVAGQPGFSIVADQDIWVEANLKETDLTHVRPGQAATVEIDAYPGRTWRARVDSIGAATGAEFSLLPPQNATGNWVKVVQRVPVRLTIEAPVDGTPLRAGMSAVVEIDTEHRRELPGIVRSALAWVHGDSAAAAQ